MSVRAARDHASRQNLRLQRRQAHPARRSSFTIATCASSRNLKLGRRRGFRQSSSSGRAQPKQYVQDRIRERHDAVWRQLNDENCYIYLCGLKGMEKGVDEAFRDVCRRHGGDWDALLPQLREKSRYHVETY